MELVLVAPTVLAGVGVLELATVVRWVVLVVALVAVVEAVQRDAKEMAFLARWAGVILRCVVPWSRGGQGWRSPSGSHHRYWSRVGW